MTRLEKTNAILDDVNSRLDALERMFHAVPGEVKPRYGGFSYAETIEAKTVYQSDNVTVTLGIWKLAGTTYPDHEHTLSVEYLIVTKGRFTVAIDGKIRVMSRGDCCAIPSGVTHSCTALEDDSRMLGICVPPEKAYMLDDRDIKRGT